MAFLKDAPAWVKIILALAGTLVSVTLAYANLKSEVKLLQREDVVLHEQDKQFKSDIKDIKEMLREELERHHPRK